MSYLTNLGADPIERSKMVECDLLTDGAETGLCAEPRMVVVVGEGWLW